jgi:glutathione-regulated potassium-efflux system ancillary protein KefC
LESILSSIDYKDPIWIAIAFLFGALSHGIGLPPLVGFLIAGFVLNFFGFTNGHFLNEMADLGVALLLFTIGLKLKIKELLQVEIWGGALAHMLIFSLVSVAILLLLKQLGLPLFSQLSVINALMISFALSFSSTVFVVKALDERGDFLARYGQIAIGILIIQDLVAVLYLGVSAAKMPSIWAIGLIVLIFVIRPLIIKLSTQIGHGELLLLFGLSMALGGSALFEAVDMKADLGALVFGVLLANTPKADELSKTLLSVKELFLVGFFLSIGMAGLPNATTLIVVSVLLILLVFKSGLFFGLLSAFKVRTFPASKASMALANYSEFGLIVTMVAVSQGWLTNEWLIVMAMLIAVSFVVSSAINQHSDDLYSRFQHGLRKYQHPSLLEEGQKLT